MDDVTIRRLNAINREFYRLNADDFDQTRGQPWPGWDRMVKYMDTQKRAATVLDVGCGNGRLGVFLASRLNGLQYQGVDSNAALLEHARESLQALPGVTFRLEERDIVENPPDAGAYDLVALFGVLHHIPGYEQRLALMRALAEQVAPGGMLAFACWRFYEYERFRERIVPWPEDVQVERNDYLLDWRRGRASLRYCHYIDDAEHAALTAATGMREAAGYRADGQTGDANRYSLLQH